jgi:hypothetical protein
MRRLTRECSLEEFDAWVTATDRFEAVAKAAEEEGGPRLSLVPLTERGEIWPTDLLSPAAPADGADAASAAPPIPAEPFDGVPLEESRKRLAGWSAERQRVFLSNLAETGSVHLASSAARLAARSAYRLRARSPAFAAAWDVAQQLAVGRLSALAFDRAIHGRIDQVWEEGHLVVEKRVPSDRMLMWLLARLDPRRFAAPWELRKDDAGDPQHQARQAFPALLEGLADAPAD